MNLDRLKSWWYGSLIAIALCLTGCHVNYSNLTVEKGSVVVATRCNDDTIAQLNVRPEDLGPSAWGFLQTICEVRGKDAKP